MTCDIKIEEVFNGYIVTIGCQRIVFGGGVSMADARMQLTIALNAYLVDRDGTEKAWRERFGRKKRASEHTHTHVYPMAGHQHTLANVGHNHPDHEHVGGIETAAILDPVHDNGTSATADHHHTISTSAGHNHGGIIG